MQNQTYQQWRQKIKQASKKTRTPIFIRFELTPACNLDCKMCYVHNAESNKMRERELSTEQWKRIFDEAYDCGMMFAAVTGGECLIRKDFKELYLHLYNKGIKLTVMTNGTLINEDYVEFFSTYKPERMQVSLYGSSEEGYQNVTGHKGFEKTVWAIRALMDAGISVYTTVTPSSYMKDDYIKILQLIEEKGFKTMMAEMCLLPKRDNTEEGNHYLTREEVVRLSRERACLHRELTPVTDLPEIGGPMTAEPVYGLPCGAGNNSALITWEGKMYPCGYVLLGGASLLEMSYAEAWEQTKAAVDTVVQGLECEGCAYQKACPSCLARRLQDLHSGRCNREICEVTRRLVACGVKKIDVQEPVDVDHEE